MPARHLSLASGFAFHKSGSERAALVDEEGVGETSGQTAGSSFSRSFASLKAGPAEENRFSSFGANPLHGSQFHRSEGSIGLQGLK